MLLLVVLVVAAFEPFVAGVAGQLVVGLVGAADLPAADFVGAAGLAVLIVVDLFELQSGLELAVTVDQIVVAALLIHVDGCLGWLPRLLPWLTYLGLPLVELGYYPSARRL